MRFKLLSEMTKEEIEYVIKEVCGINVVSVDNIEYDKDDNELIITVKEIWDTEDENVKEIEYIDTEEILFTSDTCKFYHGQVSSYKYKQYIVAKGYHSLWQNNEYWLS